MDRALGDAQCEFCALVSRIYSAGESDPIAILDADSFRFYVNRREVSALAVGSRVQGAGALLLDHYIWVEYLEEYPDPPDLFYNLRVVAIRKIGIPERLITRYDRGKTYPARVEPSDFELERIAELDTMEGRSFDEELYIIEFEDTGLESERIERTFR